MDEAGNFVPQQSIDNDRIEEYLKAIKKFHGVGPEDKY